MKVGVCSLWFNRGQATVGRYLRDALDALGHETFVLARPTPVRFARSRYVERSGVWAQPGVTELSAFDAPPAEYLEWASRTGVEAVLFDQNYEFDAIAGLRAAGVRTIGRFVWESFAPRHVADAKRSFDVVYSLTRAEQARYRSFGIESPYVPFGCHPELSHVPQERAAGVTRFFYPGGYLSHRKPTRAVLDAFRRVERDDVELIIKAQRPLWVADLRHARRVGDVDGRVPFRRRRRARAARVTGGDDRVRVIADDLELAEYYRLFASAHVCVGVSRWEGLGLHLWEATAFEMPIIATKMAPVDEVAIDGVNAVLVPSTVLGQRPGSGVDIHEPDVGALAAAMERLADPVTRAAYEDGARTRRRELAWSSTVDGLGRLLDS